MTNIEKLSALINLIENTARQAISCESNPEFNPADDGNYDDAYGYGFMDGEISLARELLAIIEGD